MLIRFGLLLLLAALTIPAVGCGPGQQEIPKEEMDAKMGQQLEMMTLPKNPQSAPPPGGAGEAQP